jgi:hypothetical protein
VGALNSNSRSKQTQLLRWINQKQANPAAQVAAAIDPRRNRWGEISRSQKSMS